MMATVLGFMANNLTVRNSSARRHRQDLDGLVG